MRLKPQSTVAFVAVIRSPSPASIASGVMVMVEPLREIAMTEHPNARMEVSQRTLYGGSHARDFAMSRVRTAAEEAGGEHFAGDTPTESAQSAPAR